MAADESIDEPEKIRDRVECINEIKGNTDCLGNSVENFEKLILLEQTNPVRELQTILRSPFVFCADRLIRLVIEEGLNQLPYNECLIKTPSGCSYQGIHFERGNCGVSVQCCRSIRIGKILINDDQKLLYSRLMPDIRRRRVILLYPLLSTGSTVLKAIRILRENGVKETNIFLLSIFSTSSSIERIRSRYKDVTIITSEIHSSVPFQFATKYFGTD